MLTIGNKAPDFFLQGILNGKKGDYSLKKFKAKWLILFFYPKDFTFICPTEVKGFNDKYGLFASLGCGIAGISGDSVETHEEWMRELGGLRYPLLSDTEFTLARGFGVFDETEKLAMRANFILNEKRVIQYAVAYHTNVGRSVEETLRVLQALGTGKLCPADWHVGEAVES